MRAAHSVAAVRAAERDLMAKLPAGTLMQRAAAGLAAACMDALEHVYGAHVVVLAGSGDNGGDALYAGARLAQRGASVTVVAAGTRLHEAGMAALADAGGRLVPAADAAGPIGSADLIIDGLTGIGGEGGLREPAAGLAALTESARADGTVVVAVDLPSGIEASTGEVQGAAVQADVTVTFGTWKPGLLIDPGAGFAGAAQLVDIGLGPYLGAPAIKVMQAADVANALPRPAAESDKYRRGVLGVVAGSDQYTGAAVLSVGAAIHAGAGMVRLLSAGPALQAVRQHWPEAVLTDRGAGPAPNVIESAGRVQAWVAGPGMGTGPDSVLLLQAVLATSLPVLVDADGITILAANPDLLPRSAPTLITPHAGELARLLQADRADIEARRLHYATTAAAKLGVTVLLKGSTTVIAGPEPDQPPFVNPTGTSWLATAGSGDVLSGIAGSLLAQKAAVAEAAGPGHAVVPAEAAAAAAYLHGLAARIAAEGAPIGAGDLIGAVPDAIRTVTGLG